MDIYALKLAPFSLAADFARLRIEFTQTHLFSLVLPAIWLIRRFSRHYRL